MEMKKGYRADACLVLCGVLLWFLADAARLRLEALKALTRTNAHITHESIAAFIETLDVAEAVKEELRALSPSTYTGVFR